MCMIKYWNSTDHNISISLSPPFRIIFMFVYMLTMFCHLSQVNPSLQPYLKLQPWCSLCSSSDYPAAAMTTGSTHQQAVEQLSMLSRRLLPATKDTGSASDSSIRAPHPSSLPTTWFINRLSFCCQFFFCHCDRYSTRLLFLICVHPCFFFPVFHFWSLCEMWPKFFKIIMVENAHAPTEYRDL